MNRSTVSVVAAVSALGIAALTTGCSSSASNGPSAVGTTSPSSALTTSSTSASTETSSSQPSTSSPATTASSTPSSAASSPAVIPTHAAGTKCTATEMPGGTWKPVVGGNGAGHVTADIALQNTSTHSCTVSGYPGISLLASDRHPLPTTVVKVPATPAVLTVAPGAWIHSEIRYSPDVPGPGEPTSGNCEPETVHALAQLPGDSAWVPVTLSMPTPVCEKGTLQAKPFAGGQSTPAGG